MPKMHWFCTSWCHYMQDSCKRGSRRSNQGANSLQRSFSSEKKPIGRTSSSGPDLRKNCQELQNVKFQIWLRDWKGTEGGLVGTGNTKKMYKRWLGLHVMCLCIFIKDFMSEKQKAISLAQMQVGPKRLMWCPLLTILMREAFLPIYIAHCSNWRHITIVTTGN